MPSDAPLFDYCLEKSSSMSTKLYGSWLLVQLLSKSSASFIQISVSLLRQSYMFVELELPDQIKLRCFPRNWRPAESGQQKVWCVDMCWLWHFNVEMFFAPGSRNGRIHSEYQKDWQVWDIYLRRTILVHLCTACDTMATRYLLWPLTMQAEYFRYFSFPLLKLQEHHTKTQNHAGSASATARCALRPIGNVPVVPDSRHKTYVSRWPSPSFTRSSVLGATYDQ